MPTLNENGISTNDEVEIVGEALYERLFNGGFGGDGSIGVESLSNVTITSLLDGQLLQYDITSGKWVNVSSTSLSYDDTALSNRVTALEAPETVVAEDNIIDFSNKYVELTATATNITATNIPNTPKEGVIIVHSAENITGWGTEFKFKTVPTALSGDEIFAYFVENSTTIWIGRVV